MQENTTQKDMAKSYWDTLHDEIKNLISAGELTTYDAEALIWAHKEEEELDESFVNNLPEELRKTNWFHTNKPRLAIAAKSSDNIMTATSAFFAVTSAIASFLVLVLPFLKILKLAKIINFISNLINNVAWDGSDSLCSAVVGADLAKNGVFFDSIMNVSMTLLLLPATILYTLTLPHIRVITNAILTTSANIGLNVIFAVSMWVSCFIELRHVIKGTAFIQKKEQELAYLKHALSELRPQKGIEPSSDTKEKIAEFENKIKVLEHIIIAQKQQTRLHKKNAYLWGASATLITGSAILTSLVVLGVVASGTLTMGVIPGVLGVACAAFAIWRWHLNRTAKINLTQKEPVDDKAPIEGKPSQAGLFKLQRSQSDSALLRQPPDSKDVGTRAPSPSCASC